MNSLNYHTIDPLILETLNLNQRRMNHILNILHGRPANSQLQSPKLKIAKNHFQNSLRLHRKQSNNSFLLPQISRNNLTIETDRSSKLNDRKYSTIDKPKPRKSTSLHKNQIISSTFQYSDDLNIDPNAESASNTMRKHKSQRKRTLNQPASPISFFNFSKIQQVKESSEDQRKRQPRISLSAVRSKLVSSKVSHLQSLSMKQLSPPKQQLTDSILEESLMPSPLLNQKQDKKEYSNYRKKTKQMINDYMGEYTLKKSKSMQVLNPKDIYRLEIQNLVAELTPIEKLQDAQKKMKRIKRRHQHLKHFDQKYYSKLNEMDLVTL